MKKALVVFITLFFVNLCISAQIQRKFFDFTLGQTTKSEVVKYFKEKQIEIDDVKENIVNQGDRHLIPSYNESGACPADSVYVKNLMKQYAKIGEDVPEYITKMETFGDYFGVFIEDDLIVETEKKEEKTE